MASGYGEWSALRSQMQIISSIGEWVATGWHSSGVNALELWGNKKRLEMFNWALRSLDFVEIFTLSAREFIGKHLFY